MALDGTTLYIGGSFTMVGATTRNGIAAINAQTGSLLSWNPGITGGSQQVSKIIPYAGKVYVFGDFTTAGGSARNRGAALDATTGLATSWDPNFNNTVLDAEIDTTTAFVYAGGQFTTINGGTGRNHLAGIDLATGLDTGWNPNADGTVWSLDLEGSNVYVGGEFLNVNGATPRNYVAAVAKTNGVATTWDPNADDFVFKVIASAPTVWLGGRFTTIGGFGRNRAAAVNTFDAGVQPFNPNPNGEVFTMQLISPNLIYLAGSFSTVGGSSRTGYASISTIFSTANIWTADSAGGPNLPKVILQTPWAVFLGGQWTSINAVSRIGFAATVP